MEKINFINGETPINDTNLNQMQDNIEKSIEVGGVAGDTLPIGTVVEFASDTDVPENWLLCNGQEVSRTEYDLLFAVIGTTYGAGDGSTTFNVPTKEGLVTVGKKSSDTDFNILGKTGGEKTHTLTVDEMPSHSHCSDGYTGSGAGAYFYATCNGTGTKYEKTAYTQFAGENQPHNNLQPYVTSNFIIKAKQSSGVVANVVDSLESDSTTDALSAKQGKKLNDKIAELTPSYIYISSNLEDFKNYVITDNAPTGISLWKLTLNGQVSMAIVIKATNDYLSFIQFSYEIDATQCKYTAGNWITSNLIN